mmetsp:Transcript_34677/g.98706  ORF Transcript_34677/g.98706 Transcript_34677/m.98706 type:complete len:228 (+) Transcript_34677:297-980(+)
MPRLAEHGKHQTGILDVQAHHLEQGRNARITRHAAELVPRHCPCIVHIQLLEDVAQVARVVKGCPPLLERHDVAVWLRELHGVLHEDPGHDIQQRDLREAHGEHEERGGHLARLCEHIVVERPIVASRGGHKVGQNSCPDGAKVLMDCGVQLRVDISPVGRQVARHPLDRSDAEQEENEHQQRKAPEQGDKGPHDGLQHSAERRCVLEQLDHAQRTRKPHQPQRPHE